MFKQGELVFYGTAGVCKIDEITTVDFSGVDKDKLFYVLCPQNSGGKIFIPVDTGSSKLRKLMSKEEAVWLISKIKEIEPLQIQDEKKPDETYKKVLQTYDNQELLKMIKCIYFRKKKRLEKGLKVTAVDEKYMHMAENMIYQELGTALDIPKDQVIDYITRYIEADDK